MKWFDIFINRPITKILRLDQAEGYELYNPLAVFLMFDKEGGMLIEAFNDGKSIQINASSLAELIEDYGGKFSETLLNELKPDDELAIFIGQSIKKIKVGEYLTEEVRGDNFIIKQGVYSGIIVETDKANFTYYNEYCGHILINKTSEFPHPESWVLT